MIMLIDTSRIIGSMTVLWLMQKTYTVDDDIL